MKNVLKIALKAIWTNKSRSFLTMLGVIIGVGSVVMLTSIGTGLQAYIEDQFDQLGANTVLVFPGDPFGEGGGFNRESQVSAIANSKLEMEDVGDIRRIREYVKIAVPFVTNNEKISYRSEEKSITLIGSTHEYPDVQTNTTTEKGRFFSKTENESKEKVIVLGYDVAEELFGNIDPIGKTVRLGSQNFKVIGVQKKVGGSFGGPSFDTYIFIPIETYFKQYDTRTIVEIIVKTKSTENIPESIKAIETQMLKKYKEDEFSVFDQSQILDTINQILGVLTLGLGGIASISLVVGGIGIMNIMLVSVTERTREIGLRKALGATPNTILLQFLVEAAILSVLGGSIGLVIAYLGTLAMQAFFPAKVTMDAVILAFGVSTAVGLIFGAAPARRASKLSPIEALRYE
ncbi:MAG: ABC transporter permease [Patescibacteria group bacterium]|nr:MAG: ABC transporter permease [Patescibacteria group bacterium]